MANVSDHAKCISLSNQPCMTRPTLIDLNLDEYDQRLHYYPFMFNIDRCNGSCNTLVVIHETNPEQIATANSYSK